MDMGIVEQVKKVMDSFQVPEWIWRPIMQLESGGNPEALAQNSKEKSHGLFQINIKAHPEYSDLDLSDPVVNAKAIIDLWQRRGVLEKAADLPVERQAAYVWRYGSRPAWTTEKDTQITNLSKGIIGEENLSPFSAIFTDDFVKQEILRSEYNKLDIPDYIEVPSLGITGIAFRGVLYGLIIIMIFISAILLLLPGKNPMKQIAKGVMPSGE